MGRLSDEIGLRRGSHSSSLSGVIRLPISPASPGVVTLESTGQYPVPPPLVHSKRPLIVQDQ